MTKIVRTALALAFTLSPLLADTVKPVDMQKRAEELNPPEKLYRDYLGAVQHGNIFSIDVGPDYAGKLREIDVRTLRRVGEMIRTPPPPRVASSSGLGPVTAGLEAAPIKKLTIKAITIMTTDNP